MVQLKSDNNPVTQPSVTQQNNSLNFGSGLKDRPEPQPNFPGQEPTLMAQAMDRMEIDSRPITYTETTQEVTPIENREETPYSNSASDLREETTSRTTIDEVVTTEVDKEKLKTPPSRAPLGVPPTLENAEVDGKSTIYNTVKTNNLQFSVDSDGGVNFSGSRLLNGNDPNPDVHVFGTGDLQINPSANVNEAVVSGSVGIKVSTPTFKQALDQNGNPVIDPITGKPLLQPTALGATETVKDYVPSKTIPAQKVEGVNGVYKVAPNQTVVIDKPDPSSTGRDQSGYTQNVGGVIVRNGDTTTFVPMWNASGHLQQQTQITASGKGAELIQALVPQQPGQDLQLGKEYSVKVNPDGSYSVSQNGNDAFNVIAADSHPQNFASTANPDVYAVEDTVTDRPNASTSFFNGKVGEYVDPTTGQIRKTIDINDANVGNQINTPEVTIPGQNGRVQVSGGATAYVFGRVGFGAGEVDKTTTTTTQLFLNTDQTKNVFKDTTTTSGVNVTTQTGTNTETTINTINATETTYLNSDGSITSEITNPQVVNSQSTSAKDLGAPMSVNIGETTNTESELVDSSVSSQRQLIDEIVKTRREKELAVVGNLTVGAGVQFTLSGTPGTEAANTLALEAFVMGDTQGGAYAGGAVEVVLNPWGSKEKLGYDIVNGKAVPMWQTQPVLDDQGNQVFVEKNGQKIAVNEFKLDANGNRIPLKVETGEARGPQFFLRADTKVDLNGGDTEIRGYGGIRIKL